MKNLVIVESPSKAKTIQKFLGDEFTVKSCMGHIRDLPGNDKAIDIENGFAPRYEVSEDKKQIVSELKKLAGTADVVWLASDEDREGEAIAWHLSEALGLHPDRTRRIVFHEITKQAISKAITHPRQIDKHLVDAQQARRVLDRLVGFGLSPILWSKIQRNLSAGRVQSVAVRLVVERERDIQEFNTTSQFKVTAEFDADGKRFAAELPIRFDLEEEAYQFLEKLLNATFIVTNIEVKPGRRSPSPPFTTSTLQQEASRKLGYSLVRTMKLAQDLYEAGHITYMRTDSTNLSELALESMSAEITSLFGEEYSHRRIYTTKVASAQEAHEAIRPTNAGIRSIAGSESGKSLYELIWKRAVASQMADARIEKTLVTILPSTIDKVFIATGEVLKFDGFLKVYMESRDDESEDEDRRMLPDMVVDQLLKPIEIRAIERYQRPPARYNEASLVRKLEELGIGRPSTYAPTISTIQARGYVVKEDRIGTQRELKALCLRNNEIDRSVQTEKTGAERAKLFPTGVGSVVTDFLVQHFGDILDYNFTATVEKQFDEIAQGDLVWSEMIREFYGPFSKTLKLTKESAGRQSGERLLGTDPESGQNVYVRLGRYGPMVQVGEADDPEKRHKGLQGNVSFESVTLEDALSAFVFPRLLGTLEDNDVVVRTGRFGPYIEHNKVFVSLPKTDDPHSIDLNRAIELVIEKRRVMAERLIKEFPEDPEVKILKGRWGPYIAVGKQNVRIPKGTDAATLTLDECRGLANEALVKDKPPEKKAATAKRGRKKA